MMKLIIRAATSAERLYADKQSQQITMQTGCVGYLRGDVGESREAFQTTWEDRPGDKKSDGFQMELDSVMKALRFDEQYSDFLKSRDDMRDFCQKHPASGFNDGLEFAFRADTAQYSYLIQLSPYNGEANLFIYCYCRDRLDHHMKHAEKGIRFITPHYKEKFRIEDGDMVRIRRFDGTSIDRICRYIDDYHLEVGNGWDSLFHICQFAEQMERCGNTVIPMRSALPDKCYSVLPSSGEIIIIKKGESGFYHADKYAHNRAEARSIVDECNSNGGVSKAQEAAMLAGSMFGWDTPAADPKSYDEQGQPIKPRNWDRGDAR